MLIPTIICAVDKRVRFEESAADNPPKQSLQRQVSSCLEPQWCDVRRDFKGRKIIVAHKGPCYGNGSNANGGGKGGTEDVKKGSNGKNDCGNGGFKNGEKEGDAKADGGGADRNGGGGGDEKV